MKDTADKQTAELMPNRYEIHDDECGVLFQYPINAGHARYGWQAPDREDWPEGTRYRGDLKHASALMKRYPQMFRKSRLVGIHVSRGRPATGQAMTAAERKAAQREQLPGFCMDVSITECSDTALFAAMQRARRDRKIVIAEMLAAEYLRRITDTE